MAHLVDLPAIRSGGRFLTLIAMILDNLRNPDPFSEPDRAIAELCRLAETSPHLLEDIGMREVRNRGDARVWNGGRYRVRIRAGAVSADRRG